MVGSRGRRGKEVVEDAGDERVAGTNGATTRQLDSSNKPWISHALDDRLRRLMGRDADIGPVRQPQTGRAGRTPGNGQEKAGPSAVFGHEQRNTHAFRAIEACHCRNSWGSE